MEREQESSPALEGSVAPRVARSVEEIVRAAEAAAAALTRDTQQRAESRLREAEAEAERRLEAATRRTDALEAAGHRRAALTDSLAEYAEAVLGKLQEADAMRAELEELLRGLQSAAARLTEERFASGQPGGGLSSSPLRSRTAVGGEPKQEFGPERVARSEPEDGWQPPEPQPAGVGAQPGRSGSDSGQGQTPFPRASRTGLKVGSGAGLQSPDGGGQGASARLVAVHMAAAGSTREEVARHLERVFDVADPDSILDGVFGPAGGRG